MGWLFVLVPACFHPSYDHPMCGPNGECPSGLNCSALRVCEDESAPDGGTTAPPSRCFGSFVTVCFTTLVDVPKMPLTLTDNPEVDTDLPSPLCNQKNDKKDDYCVVAGAGFTLPATNSIRGYGSRPLVLLSTTTMTLETTSTVDVSSNHTVGPQARGAGGDSSMCTSGMPPEMAGGGYGGSFGGKGGDGERLTGAAATSGVAAATLTSPPTMLRGGCAGGTGEGVQVVDSGAGGHGGGAVALIAATSIQLDGKVNASGAGGHGGPALQSGGGGGGSGGMIVLDSPSIMATGLLFANGGGGGQGGDGTGANMGIGDDGGESAAPPTPAPAGNNTGRDGGAGGTGSAGTTISRLNGSNGGTPAAGSGGGGGGGGGGAGFIRAHGITGDLISPPSFVP